MSRPSSLAAVLYNTEASWAEATSTYAQSMNVTNEVDVSKLTWTKFVPQRIVQYRNETTPESNGYMGGEFEVEFGLHGLGSTAAGTITPTDLMTLLALVIGNGAASRTGALTATGGTASVPTVSVASGTTAGALARIGVVGDGRGNGQFVQVTAHGASAMTLRTAIDVLPSNGDVIYNVYNLHPSESPTSNDITSTRWRFLTANQQYECKGCYPRRITLTGLVTGQEPKVRIAFGVSVWAEISATFPDTTTKQVFPTCPVAAGSFVLNTFNTTTRDATTKISIRDFNLQWELGISPLLGPGGVSANQMCVGAKRTSDKISFDFVEDAESVTVTPKWRTKWTANTQHEMTYSLACVDGSALGIRIGSFYPTGDVPLQMNMDGLNRVRFKGKASADSTRANEIGRAAIILGIG